MAKKKLVPLIFVLVGIAFLLGAIISWFDNLTASEPVGLGKWIFDILIALIGAGSGIKGWLDWNKKEPASQITNNIAFDGGQVALGEHGRNIQIKDSSQYVEQNIEHYYEAPKIEAALRSLHQLPPAPADFTGRETFIEELLQDFNSHKGATISGLTGMGGIGKTALGLTVAHKIRDKYPDAQLFLDLKGTSVPLSTMEIMRHIILSFEPAADLSTLDEAGTSAVYQSVLHKKRVLLFFDNARSAEQVALLSPSDTCAMLVTSRWTFSVPGLHNRRIDVMRADDARSFLLELCSRINEKADELAKACAYLPLALRIAGSFLQINENWTIENYLTQLNNHKQRLSLLHESRKEAELTTEPDLIANFDLSYNQLSEENRKHWRILGVFSSSFSGLAAQMMWHLPQEETTKLLNLLKRFSLLEAGENDDRYLFHDLLREYAILKMNDGEEAESRYSSAKYYLELLRYVNYLYSQGPENVKFSLKILDSELQNIIDARLWAKGNSDSNEILALINEFPSAGYRIISLRLHPHAYIDWLKAGLDAAIRLGKIEHRASHLNNLGSAYLGLSEFHTAISYYENALQLAQESRNRKAEVSGMLNLGLTYTFLGEITKALEFLENGLAKAREYGDRDSEGSALSKLGIVYRDLGDANKALDLHLKSLDIAREVGNRKAEADSMDELGIDYGAVGNINKAIEYFLESLKISRNIGNRALEGTILNNLGVIHGKSGKTHEAIDYLNQQLAIARELEDPRGECNVLGNLGIAYLNLGDSDKAITYHEQNLSLAKRIGYRKSEAAAFTNLGSTYGQMGKMDKCVYYLQQALPIFEELRSPQPMLLEQN